MVMPKFFEVSRKGRLSCWVESREGGLGGTEILAEELNDLAWRRWVVEGDGAPRGVHVWGVGGQALLHDVFAAPQNGSGKAWRRRNVLAHQAELLSHESFRCPVGHRNGAAGTT